MLTIPLVRRSYLPTWRAMREFTEARDPDTPDELWLVEHDPVFTLGRAGDPAHVLDPHDVPVVETDRGGQVTYHGPGQLVFYLLYDLKRAGIGVRSFVQTLEQAVIDVVGGAGVPLERRPGAPGVYASGRKLAALGIRVRRGCSYHGLALNVDMDLRPFSWINPCGYEGLDVTQLRTLGIDWPMERAAALMSEALDGLLSSGARGSRRC